jgi:hypothetical protein
LLRRPLFDPARLEGLGRQRQHGGLVLVRNFLQRSPEGVDPERFIAALTDMVDGCASSGRSP